jgi:glucose-6-phosphate 1-epimerase
MTLNELKDNFGLPSVLDFAEHNGLICVQVHTAAAEATIYLHGAHLTHWQPARQSPVLFLSPQSDFAPGKAIRGGVPICFPWFGPRWDGGPGPSHGFARIQEWELAFAALAGEEVRLVFTLAPSELSRSLGFDSFRVAYEVVIGRQLSLRLTVANVGEQPMKFEEALHAYFAVSDVRETALTGLEGAKFLDKTDGMREKPAPAEPLRLTGETDRVFPSLTDIVTIDDGRRRIIAGKTGSATTVVWNPWSELAKKLADLPDDAWPEFVCVETANTGADAITLAPGASHTMSAEISVEGA